MSSAQKYTARFREQVNKTLTQQIQTLEDELKDLSILLAAKVHGIGYKLEALRHAEFPSAELILNEYFQEIARKRELEGEMLAFFTRGLRTKETQKEILVSLLDSAANCFPCVALFTVRGGMLKGWSSRGFSGSTAKTISSDEFNLADCSWLLEVLMNGDQAESADLPDAGSLHVMREESSGSWRLYPLHVFGRPVAILFAGEAEGVVGRTRALSALVDCASLRLENVALKIFKTQGESAPGSADAAAAAAAPSVDDHAGSQLSQKILSGVLNLTSPIEIPAPAECAGESHPEPDAFLPDPLAGLKLVARIPEPVAEKPAASEPVSKPIPESAPEPASEPTPESEPAPEPEPKPTPEPAPDPKPETSPEPEKDDLTALLETQSTEEEKLHAAAKRFAELLASGIRLYKEDAVYEGRKNRDLYKRLRRDIDHNREMYEKRVAPTVARKIDYLHREFVRILGNGDAGVFGDGYPGPQIGGQSGL